MGEKLKAGQVSMDILLQYVLACKESIDKIADAVVAVDAGFSTPDEAIEDIRGLLKNAYEHLAPADVEIED